MAFQSNLDAVLAALSMSKEQALNIIGTTCTADVQLIEPVKTGNMRRATTFEVASENEVDIGVTNEAPYAIYVDQGTSKQSAQEFLENGIMQGVNQSVGLIEDIYSSNLGR